MKSKILIQIFLLIAISLIFRNISVARGKEIQYMKDGISFSLPQGWKIIANDSIGKNAYYFSAENSEPKATGLITVTWLNEIKNPLETLIMHQKTMKISNIYRNPGIEFTSAIPEKFIGFSAQSCIYTTIVKEQKLEGVIYCFNSSQKTITIFFQTGLNDKKLNKKVLELFKITFNCRD